jgi:lipoprotein-releasing system ATP-binding protein
MLRVLNLTKYFEHLKAKVYALKNVSFSLEQGQSLSICGASGAGKTTLLSLLGGLSMPSSGQVFFGDYAITHLDSKTEAKFRNENLGFVFQFHYLLHDFSVLENVMLPLLIQGVEKSQAEERATQMLKKVEIGGMGQRFPKELSGGEQQRAAIARGLIHEPKLILADEPTGNLDDENGHKVFELLCKLNHDLGSTLIVVTHHSKFAQMLSHKLVLENGEVKAFEKV